MTVTDHYAELGVPSTATTAEIAAAYRLAAKRWHPDRNPSTEAADRMAAINTAYQLLRDPARRVGYDAELAATRPPQPSLNAPQVRWHLRSDETAVPVRITLSNLGGDAERMGLDPTEGTFWHIAGYRVLLDGDRLIEYDLAPRSPNSLALGWHRQVIYAFLDDQRERLLLELEVQPAAPDPPAPPGGPDTGSASPTASTGSPSPPVPAWTTAHALLDLGATAVRLVTLLAVAGVGLYIWSWFWSGGWSDWDNPIIYVGWIGAVVACLFSDAW